MKTTRTKSSGNVFKDLGFPKFEAENLKMRSQLMLQIEKYIAEHELTQSEAAEVFDVDQPRISKLLNGRIELFTIDKLLEMLAKVDVTFELKAVA